MAAELGLLSLTQLQKLAQQQQQSKPGMWNWTSRRPLGDDGESWEVRAFAQDTGGAMGTTWPPRSYTCTFCHREFRSAQALGGHMNVHRRDRARLRQSPQGSEPSSSATSNPTVAFPPPDFVPGSGLCLFYPLPSPGAGFSPAAAINAPSTLLSMSPDQDRALNLLPGMAGSMGEMDGKLGVRNHDGNDGMVVDEIDLELRLGRR